MDGTERSTEERSMDWTRRRAWSGVVDAVVSMVWLDERELVPATAEKEDLPKVVEKMMMDRRWD